MTSNTNVFSCCSGGPRSEITFTGHVQNGVTWRLHWEVSRNALVDMAVHSGEPMFLPLLIPLWTRSHNLPSHSEIHASLVKFCGGGMVRSLVRETWSQINFQAKSLLPNKTAARRPEFVLLMSLVREQGMGWCLPWGNGFKVS